MDRVVERANRLHEILARIPIRPGVKAYLELHSTSEEPELGEIRCFASEEGWDYGICVAISGRTGTYQVHHKDAVGKLTDMGRTRDVVHSDSFRVSHAGMLTSATILGREKSMHESWAHGTRYILPRTDGL